MVLMKAAKGRKRGGNQAPNKRTPFPDVCQQALDSAIHSYCRHMGVQQAFNMYSYKNLQPQQAEHPQSIAKLAKLLEVLLGVSSCAKIKYKALKETFVVLLQTWGLELLKAHWNIDDTMLAGRAADSVGVLLKHWRRSSSSDVAWERLISKLDESDAMTLERVKKMTTEDGKQQVPKKRQLKLNHSEVSKDSSGWPNMVANPVDSEEDGEEGGESESEAGSSSLSDESLPLA